MTMPEAPKGVAFRKAVQQVAGISFGYFVIEVAVALAIGSVSLFADSIGFLEEAARNLLILLALFGWAAAARARLGIALGALMFLPTIAALWTAWERLVSELAPAPVLLTLTGIGALTVNIVCAILLAEFRRGGNGVAKAVFQSVWAAALANVGIILAGLVTAYTLSIWPDLVVGLGILTLNATAAHKVWMAAREEQLNLEP